jgi:hypothetical protein
MTNICQLENGKNTTCEVQAAAMDDRTFKEVVIEHMDMIDECPLMFSEEICQIRRVSWSGIAELRSLAGGPSIVGQTC